MKRLIVLTYFKFHYSEEKCTKAFSFYNQYNALLRKHFLHYLSFLGEFLWTVLLCKCICIVNMHCFVWNFCVHPIQIFIAFILVNICCCHSLSYVLLFIRQLTGDYCLVCFVTSKHFMQFICALKTASKFCKKKMFHLQMCQYASIAA